MNHAAASQIICVGTAWVEGFSSVKNTQAIPVPGTDLQFSRRGLDSSLMTTLNVILLGITYTAVATAYRTEQPIDLGLRRIGSLQVAPYHSGHVYECSAEFCKRMAALTPERVKEIAQSWYALQGHNATSSRPGAVEHRTEIIQNLAAMARVAEDRSARLLFRAMYEADT